MPILRRTLLLTPMLWGTAAHAADNDEAVKALRQGGAVAAFRHTLAPGTYDPPGFKLGDCSTQRNLSDEGRTQARQLGAWFTGRQLRPARVRSSPWCRCIDTAQGAFGSAEAWAALGSPVAQSVEARNAQQLALRAALKAAGARRDGFEVWVTHQFVMNDLAQVSLAQGEGLVLRADAAGAPQVVARILAV